MLKQDLLEQIQRRIAEVIAQSPARDIEANLKAMSCKTGGVFNVGSGRAFSFNQVVAELNRALKTDLQPDYFENPYSFTQDWTEADISHRTSWKVAPGVTYRAWRFTTHAGEQRVHVLEVNPARPGVSIVPGYTTFTCTPCSPSSWRSPSAKPTMAHLLAAYAA